MARTDPEEGPRHEAAFASSRADRDATLRAIHRLEAAAGTAAPGREADWLGRVVSDLRSLRDAIGSERDESLHHRRARETDLVYEAIAMDLGRSPGEHAGPQGS